MPKIKYPVLPLRSHVCFTATPEPLMVGREGSLSAIHKVMSATNAQLVCLTQKDPDVDDPSPEDFYSVGTLVNLVKVIEQPPDGLTVIVSGESRISLTALEEVEEENAAGETVSYLLGTFEPFEDVREGGPEEAALMQSLKETAVEVANRAPDIAEETTHLLQNMLDPVELVDFIATHMESPVSEKMQILMTASVNTRMRLILEMLSSQLSEARTQREIQEAIRSEQESTQREYYLRSQLRAIRQQLGEEDEAEELLERIEEANMPPDAYAAATKQYNRLSAMQPSSSEYSVTLNYIETLLEVPWGRVSEDNLDLNRAQSILDADHYGLEKVKRRIIEYLAVRGLKSDMRGPILCLHGPPGVGKTSLASSIARTLGRKFQRISLGGVHDESEIRGHRRTYVGAMPGRLVQKLQKAETMNPLILLDEIDKVGRDFRGDPSAALLEVLDPEQNHSFSDHYLEVDLDLSQVLFLATANQLDTISPPLRDRMEIIDVPSYTIFEKTEIAKTYLVPKQIKAHGIGEANIEIPDDALRTVIDSYTREAGVRNLERRVADICRAVAVQVAKEPEEERHKVHVTVGEDEITEALGPIRYISEVAQRQNRIGVATGLAWTKVGGDILFIEAQQMTGKGELKLTGQLGDVMKESVHAAVSYIRAHRQEFGLDETVFKENDIHLHVPAGAIPKDGPSAGITMFSAILSRLMGIPIKKDVAMTGEITLSGNILPVGGIKEKVIAAHRAGIREVCLPKVCMKDLVDVEDRVKDEMTFYPVDHVSELPGLVFVTNPFTPAMLESLRAAQLSEPVAEN